MRLHSLRLRAVGPFAGEQTIDFEPLGAGGLFLLDGPTGAGKSTVLDAITFALYGPGDGNGWGRLHSHFAAPGTAPQVQLEFSLRGVRQRITRSPEFLRPKRRGDGTTREAAQVHLERVEAGQWVSRSSNKAEVGEMLEDDLGLTREQFTQVVLLPQGEFMRFLRANDDERRTLLTKLFGTQLYDRITDELDRRRVVAARDLEAADRRLRARVAAAGESAGLDAAEQDELGALPAADRDARLAAAALELAATAHDTATAAARAAAVRDDLRAQAERATAQRDVLRRWVPAWERHHAHEQTRPDYERAAELLSAAERAEPVRALVEACADAEAEAAAALDALLAIEPSAGEALRAGLGAAELTASAGEADRLAAELAAVAAREHGASEVAAALTRARRDAERADVAAARLAERQAALPAELAEADDVLTAARAAASSLDGLTQRRDATAARLAAVQAVATLEPRLADARAARERAFEAWEQATTRHLELVSARLANMAAELAGDLVDGEPCAVCGGTDHPAPARPADGAASAADVATAEQLRARAEQHRQDAAVSLAELQTRHAALIVQVDGASADDLVGRLTALDAELLAARRAAAGLVAAETSRHALEVESAELASAQQAAAAGLATARASCTAAERRATELAAELSDAAGAYPSVAARRQALLAEARRTSALAEAVTSRASALAACEAAVSRASREAAATGFDELDEVRAAVQPRAVLKQLRTVAGEWDAAAGRLRGALEVEEFAGLDVADAEAVEHAAAQAGDRLAVAEEQAAALELAARRARDAASRFTAALADVEAARREHGDADRAAAPVVHLARLAKGVAGQRRVALTTYVLRQWFEQVVAAANARLSGMSSGRYELVRVDEGSTRTERVGLTLQVLDRHTGEQRNARSLSGGETFYTSLALALGLADVVRAEAGGVDLDTLFIDEGFGSLDAETLDQVMAVIDDLRDRGRTVGIVSHVHELKDRIAERIEVRRLPDGSSTLRVVA